MAMLMEAKKECLMLPLVRCPRHDVVVVVKKERQGGPLTGGHLERVRWTL